MSLYRHAHEGNAAELLRLLAGSDSPAVRKRAAEHLGESDGAANDETVDGLIAAARGDDDGAVRGAAVDALDELGTDAVERLLAELTGVDVSGGADRAAARRFAEALDADRSELRMAAANALGRVGDEEAVPRLVRALDDPEDRVRVRAANALGAVGDGRAVGPLTGLLSAEDEPVAVRRAAADALARIGADAALDPLLELLADDRESLRWIAANALGGASSARPVPALATALSDGSAAVRRAAVYSVVQLLSNAPQDRSHRVRRAVVAELGTADDATVVDPLVEILVEGSQRPPRRNAAWLLGRVAGDDRREPVADALVDALDDDDATLSQFAATGLVELGGEAVEERLLDVVGDPGADGAARSKAAFVLGRVGGERARERLERLTNEADDEEVRRSAFSALSKLGGMA